MVHPLFRRVRPRLEVLEDRTVPSTFVVRTTLDSGPGSLRQAILDANANPGLDTVIFAPSIHRITLTSGELTITDSLNIVGPGSGKLCISGDDISRVLDITRGSVSVSGLTITDGRADQSSSNLPSAGGGILNQGSLTLTDVVVSDNEAVGDAATANFYGPYFLAGAGLGGGVANLSTLTLEDCKIADNQALGADGAVGPNFPNVVYPGTALGGGLYNLQGTTHVTDSAFDDNRATAGSNCTGSFAGIASGGGIYNDANLTVSDSSFTENQARGGSHNTSDLHAGHGIGGAIASGAVAALFGLETASLTVNYSQFAHNQAVGGDGNTLTLPPTFVSPADGPDNAFGGAICVFQGSGAVNQSQFHDNQARGGAGGAGQNGSLGVGGGIFFFDFIGGVSGTVDGCALVGNVALGGGVSGPGGDGIGGGLACGGLGAAFSGPGTVSVRDSIVAGNLAQGGAAGPGGSGGNGLGGGLWNGTGSALDVIASLFALNRARGGEAADSGSDGQGIGGGLYLAAGGSACIDANTAIIFNHASTSHDDVFGNHTTC
jgi:hypothetical protein